MMNNKTKTGGKAKTDKQTQKVSYYYKPDNMTLEQWQIRIMYPEMNILWFIGEKEANGITARAWISKPVSWVLASTLRRLSYG